jgi:hypothetical protein
MTIIQLKRKATSILKTNNIQKSESNKSKIKSCNVLTEGFYYTKGDRSWEANLSYICKNDNVNKKQFEKDVIIKMYNALVAVMDESWFKLEGNTIILSSDE